MFKLHQELILRPFQLHTVIKIAQRTNLRSFPLHAVIKITQRTNFTVIFTNSA